MFNCDYIVNLSLIDPTWSSADVLSRESPSYSETIKLSDPLCQRALALRWIKLRFIY